MNNRDFGIAVAALVLAAVAVPIAIVAIVRAGNSTAPSTPIAGMSAMSGSHSMSNHMAAAPTSGVEDATATRGGEPLVHAVDGETWVFRLTTKPVKWQILSGTRVTAWTYNGTVPGPEIRVPYGQKVRVIVNNQLPEPTTVHWHGIQVPNSMDGVPGVTQDPIGVGKTFTYTFRAIPAGGGTGGTFMYHSHFDEDRQVGLGLSAPLIIDPPARTSYAVDRTLMLAEWNVNSQSGDTRPPMDMDGMLPNYFTINGKSYPSTDSIDIRPGKRALVRLVGAGQFTHPMHLHGTAFTVIAEDGHPLASPYKADVVSVAPGERYDIVFTEPKGKWLLHCHIGHHLTNDGESPGGLLMLVNSGVSGIASFPSSPTGSHQSGGDHTGTNGSMPGMDMSTPTTP